MDPLSPESVPPTDLPTNDQVEPIAEALFNCPNCGQAVDASATGSPVLECSHCGAQFFSPTSGANDAQETQSEEDSDRESELSELRIRQLVVLRRSAYRTRSYFIVGTLVCFVMGTQLGIFAFERLRLLQSSWLIPASQILFAIAFYMGMLSFARRVIDVQRSINSDKRAREEEEREAAKNPPDLSTLSDGSHRARNLERMVDENLADG